MPPSSSATPKRASRSSKSSRDNGSSSFAARSPSRGRSKSPAATKRATPAKAVRRTAAVAADADAGSRLSSSTSESCWSSSTWIMLSLPLLFVGLVSNNFLLPITAFNYVKVLYSDYFFETLSYGMIATGLFTFGLLFFFTAPYGRHAAESKAWGPLVNARVAWILMECPNLVFSFYFFFVRNDGAKLPLTNKLLLGMFVLHYINRDLIFPFRTRGGKPMPFTVMMSAFFYTSWNGYIQAVFLTERKMYPDSHLRSPFFILGAFIFFSGFYLNNQADTILINLRKPGDKGYYIPYGGLFNWLSGANFAAEILEWFGFAIAMGPGGVSGWCFAIFCFCNTAPRAAAHHKWYEDKFGDEYKKLKRNAVIPFVW